MPLSSGVRPVIDCSKDKIRTKQHFKHEVDINSIMSKYLKTGVMTQDALSKRQATFADVSQMGDYKECHDKVIAARAAFMTLAPAVRSKFENNPAQILDFLADEANRDEAIELGIIPKPEPEPIAESAPEPAPKQPEPSSTA